MRTKLRFKAELTRVITKTGLDWLMRHLPISVVSRFKKRKKKMLITTSRNSMKHKLKKLKIASMLCTSGE